MQVECKECRRPLNLPDDKLPVGRPFSFNCPSCKTKNTAFVPAPEAVPAEGETLLSPAPSEAAPSPVTSEFPVPPAAEPSPRPVPDIAYPSPSDSGLDESAVQSFLAVGVDERPKALVVYDDEETAELLVSKLEYIGYQATVALNLRDAAKQLKFLNFSLLLIQEDYFGSSLNGNHLVRAVQSLDNQSRRGLLVALISPNLTTLDDLTAFGLSLDAVINRADLEHIDRILLSSIARAKKFYAVYREILAEHGLD